MSTVASDSMTNQPIHNVCHERRHHSYDKPALRPALGCTTPCVLSGSGRTTSSSVHCHDDCTSYDSNVVVQGAIWQLWLYVAASTARQRESGQRGALLNGGTHNAEAEGKTYTGTV